MRVAAILMAAVLLTTCAISGTFAKYTTSDAATDTARVAKFGVTISATSGSAFAATYATDEDPALMDSATPTPAAINYSVTSANGTDKVIAPGTSGTVTAYSISGTPEVAVTVTYTAALDLGDDWEDANGDYYCPLIFTVGGTEIDGQDYASADLFEAAVNAAIAGFTANYQANTNLATAAAPAISWEWPFETTGNDANDTFLGDQAAAGTAATVTLDTTCTVTQID